MQARKLAIACLALSSLCAGIACAKKLDTFAGSVDLPYDFHVKYRIDEAINGSLYFSASQSTRIVFDSGPLQGKEATLLASYFVPVRGDASLVQGWVQKTAEEAAAKPGASGMQPVQLSGFPFILLTVDATRDKPGTTGTAAAGATSMGTAGSMDVNHASELDQDSGPQRNTWMSGSINNALLSVSLMRPANVEFDATASKAVKELNLDFASILKTRTRFDDAARVAVSDKKMITATGDYTTVDDITPRLYSSWAKSDGKGKVIGSKNIYSFFKMGFWTQERSSFSSYCSLADGQDAKVIAQVKDFAKDTKYDKVVVDGTPTEGKLGGLDATHIETRHTYINGLQTTKSEGSRWVAIDHDTYYVFDFLTTSGASLEPSLASQINARPLTCTPKAQVVLGDAPAAP